MADQFQTFDKAPIVPDTITFRAWRFGFREMILGAIALILLFMCFLFAGLFGSSTVQLQEARTSAQVAMARSCKDSPCLKTTAHAMELLNISVNPCDNFFQFACGGYTVTNPLNPDQLHDNILRQMYDLNQDRLVAILEASPENYMTWSSEVKLKDFYASCTDDFTKEQVKGKPLFDKVFPLLGGWYVKDATWSASWDLNIALKHVQTDLWLDAMYAPWPGWDQYNWKNRIISVNVMQIYPAGTGYYMRWAYYKENPTDPKIQKIQTDYKTFMRTVANLVARDAKVAKDQALGDRIEVFVNDAFTIEQKIAKMALAAEYQGDPYSEANKQTLDDLTRTTGNVIDWTAQMAYLFDENRVSGSTKVVVPYPTYLTNLTAMISIPCNSVHRMLHNYLTWRVLETYVQDLSWEYVHANRQMYVDLYGRVEFLGTQRYCFMLAKRYFDVALGALYVNTHFDEKNKVKVTEVTESVKQALEDMIQTNTWMDADTKKYAMDKMRGSTYKIGYPDFMKDQSKVDAIYQQMSINVSDFFGNLLAANQQHKREWNRELREGEDRSQWIFNTYDTNLAVYWYWDEIIVPAGILQFPVYTHGMPHYYSFGAIGTLLGHFVHHLVDERGARWDKGGDYMDSERGWWSNLTYTNYNAVRQCVVDLYNNVTQGPYDIYNGEKRTVAVNGGKYAYEAIAITTGIRLAYNAYTAWQRSKGADPHPPGLQYTPEQMFFIGHAQTYCYNRDPSLDYTYTRLRNANEETRVNLALQELPEFSKAFGCSAPSKMAPTQRCTYY
ncbi:hypothetical protein BaRGS_00018604 [Batillaria attramentaria]|uniref:Uncharacterized protein n=1 Tax=Batillaria attramentaria TaxID=370345 RepID=A0ABD0KS44_9CAEN